jgi:hypothetical protein
MRPTTAPAISSSSRATVPANRMTPAEAAKLVEDLHAPLQPIDGHPTRFSVCSSHAPSTQQRKQLCAVVERLERDLAEHGAPDEREYAIGRFLLGYEKGKGSELNAGLLNEEFLEAVAGQPVSAIAEACARFRQGKTLLPVDAGWRPSPDQFALEVAEGLVPARTRLLRARRILAAEVYDPPTAEQLAEVEKARKAASDYLTRRMPEADVRPVLAEPDEGPRSGPDIVAPLRSLDVSHLMANLDRKRVSA